GHSVRVCSGEARVPAYSFDRPCFHFLTAFISPVKPGYSGGLRPGTIPFGPFGWKPGTFCGGGPGARGAGTVPGQESACQVALWHGDSPAGAGAVSRLLASPCTPALESQGHRATVPRVFTPAQGNVSASPTLGMVHKGRVSGNCPSVCPGWVR